MTAKTCALSWSCTRPKRLAGDSRPRGSSPSSPSSTVGPVRRRPTAIAIIPRGPYSGRGAVVPSAHCGMCADIVGEQPRKTVRGAILSRPGGWKTRKLLECARGHLEAGGTVLLLTATRQEKAAIRDRLLNSADHLGLGVHKGCQGRTRSGPRGGVKVGSEP